MLLLTSSSHIKGSSLCTQVSQSFPRHRQTIIRIMKSSALFLTLVLIPSLVDCNPVPEPNHNKKKEDVVLVEQVMG